MKSRILMAALLLLGPACGQTETTPSTSQPAPASAKPPSPSETPRSGFIPTGEFELRIDGEADPQARLFRSARPPAWLIMAPSLSQTVMLKPTTHQVLQLKGEKITESEDGSLLLDDGHESDTSGNFQVRSMPDGSSQVDFKLNNRAVQMVKKPNLRGPYAAAQLQAYEPYYRWKSFQYQPDANLLDAISKASAPVEIQVFFGSWCPYCKEYIPHLMAVERAVATPSIRFSYYGLPRDFSLEPLTTVKKIQRVPTAIVTSQGKTLGRLVGRECEQPEKKLSQIISKLAKG